MEFTPFASLVVLAGLCAAFTSTRKYAVILTGLLMYFYPIHSFGALALAGLTFFYFNRRKSNAVSRLFNRGP
mgnify:CR=1 FL=1